MEKTTVRRNYKDVLFRRVFSDKESLLELYNAVNGTNYEDPEELTVVTLEDAIYMNVKNDIAFLVGSYLNLYEHQSTVNPNMPLRCLFYITREYEKLMDKASLYSSKLRQIPTPRFLVFYNGKQEQSERHTLQLSTAFQTEEENPELELRVTVLNINYGKNKELLRQQRAEVIAMSIFYYDEEKELELIRKDEYELGHEAGRQEGRAEGIALTIIKILSDLGEVPEWVREKIYKETGEEQTDRWLRLAVRAGSLEEFLKEF